MQVKQDQILDNDLTYLKGRFEIGQIVLFTGAGFSRDAENIDGEKIPSALGLRDKIWNLCFPEESINTSCNLAARI